MTGTQEDISSMISFTKLVETNPCLWNFTSKSSRTDLTSLAWRKIAAEFKDIHSFICSKDAQVRRYNYM
jgi:hypothetical protein